MQSVEDNVIQAKLVAMIRQWASHLGRQLSGQIHSTPRFFSTVTAVEPEDMPFVHLGDRPRYSNYKKFKSPRRRASKLFEELKNEAVEKSKQANPALWEEKFRVGDALELKIVSQGGVHSKEGADNLQEVDKVRGVVLGIVNRGLGSSVILRDVVFGEPIERKIPLHSPMVKELKVLERNFIFKGKKRVKRAKLYYLRDLNPLRKCFVTGYVSCLICASFYIFPWPNSNQSF